MATPQPAAAVPNRRSAKEWREGGSKLGDREVSRIIELAKADLTITQIAIRMSVHHATVSRIIKQYHDGQDKRKFEREP